jgi:hypothetical protein
LPGWTLPRRFIAFLRRENLRVVRQRFGQKLVEFQFLACRRACRRNATENNTDHGRSM